ncbi:uncharacterized protein LOC122510628 [Leptopilina heterotoma]|uniref:uncharacterized protein LOC122510628 n=1 Tax=Leptopilina heterotoma TaxID=63436 RepID=UPI001CA8D768|nr:uncharacterized protein LOC122510628 [Leptopilina heterotoma]
MKKPKMHSQSTFSITLTLIFLLMAGQISIYGENNVEETEIKSLTFENDICSIYDNSKIIDSVLFERKYKPLVVIIAEKFIDGINRVRNLSASKRVLNNYWIMYNPYYRQLHQTILGNIYLLQANDTYYFIYPVDFQDHLLTIYSQKKLLKDNLGITFDFVNVKKESSFYEDILIPLEPSCTNCPLVNYVKEKLQKGESFAELFQLRKQLFKEQKTKNLSFNAFDNDNICASMGFNLNSQSLNSYLRFNLLLKQIQSKSKSIEKIKKRSTVERSLTCFQSRNFEVTEDQFLSYVSGVKDVMVSIDYLNWINNTISSLKSNDNSFGGLCENEHKIGTFKLFCFITGISEVTSHNTAAWIEALKEYVAKSLIGKLSWFNRVIFLYKKEYFFKNNSIFSLLYVLKRRMLYSSNNWRNVMNITYNIVKDSLGANTNYNDDLMFSSTCTIYKHWKTIDDLLLAVKFKRLVIIVTESMREGIRTVNQIRASRVEPKVKREDLHYSEQFLYDFIMKHIYLVQSNDTHYYVYPTTINRQENPLIGYFEYNMIKDYLNVVFYFVNSRNYFSRNESSCINDYDSVIPALLDYRDISSGNSETRFINPAYLIKVHQDFFNRFPKYFTLYAFIYNDLTQFVNNYDQHYRSHGNITYFQEFRNFLKKQQISFDRNYLFTDLSCLYSRKLNNRTDIDFSMTNLVNIAYFNDLLYYAYSDIISINDTDNTNLYSLCSNREIFKFLKFFCFLKINYIDDMIKVTDQKSVYVFNMKGMVNNEKNLIMKYLINTSGWLLKLYLMQYNDYKYNETRMFKESDALYSQIPKITFNDADLSNKIYSILKNNTIFLQCEKFRFVATKETTSNGDDSSTENYLVLSKNKTSPKLQEADLIKEQRKKLCLVPS